MIRRALLGVAAALTLAGLAACGGGGEKAAKSNEVTFSILSTESAQNMEGYWEPILKDMEKSTGLTVKPFFSSSYGALVEAMRFKQTDVGWFSNRSGLEAVRRSNGEVFARTFDDSGTDGYRSIIVVRKDSPITAADLLKCDKKLSLGMGDVKSTSGNLAPMALFFTPAGIDPAACFKNLLVASNYQANMFAVANGKLDVAIANSTALQLSLARGDKQTSQLKVIWQSDILPEDPMVWRKDLDPAVKEKVRQFFLTYGQGDTPEAARQRENMKRLSIGGFRAADDSHLLFVRKMEAGEELGLARRSRDPAKIAAAQKTLDAVEAEIAAAAAKAGAAGTN
ncbi:MAG TPA: phosphate/phosphite/phosphonate ABC transporter substrate-binding protein [Caulobacter sp.]|nr:phosphate/phosphite/phosphonate ABC transporter substrate-binding protein [Caulobacter sp.]